MKQLRSLYRQLNKPQRGVLGLCILVILTMCLYPPVIVRWGPTYRWLGTARDIAAGKLAFQILIAAVVGGIIVFLLGSKTTDDSHKGDL